MNRRSQPRRMPSRASLVPGLAMVLLGIVVLGPTIVSRGYVLAGDMTFVPDQPWKPAWLGLDGSVPRAVPADAVVSVLGQAIPGDLLQKAVLLGTLALAGVGMLRLTTRVPGIGTSPRFGAAALYVWNPFVFERLAIGHWGLMIGYADLPWVLAAALDVRRAEPRAQARLLILLLVAAAGSPTGGLVAGLVALTVVASHRHRRRTATVLGALVVVNLPWLVPALANDAAPSDGTGVSAFAARADTPFGLWGSLVSFGGIWKEAATPPERDAGLLSGLTLLVVAASLVVLVLVARGGRYAEVLAARRLVILAIIGVVLAGLPATGAGGRLVADLVETVPGAGLWRDSQKWLMPFVLAGCLGFALLLESVSGALRRRRLAPGPLTTALALLPVVLLPSLAWGLTGRYDPVSYPEEWRVVRRVLEAQPAVDRRTAVLPWSAYQRLPWNGGRAALDPAQRFFPGQFVTNEDLVLDERLTVPGQDRSAAAIGRAIAAGSPLGPALAGAGVRYVLVERTASGADAVSLPEGRVLHQGDELLLLDLGGPGRTTRSPHESAIVVADLTTVLAAALAGAMIVIRRRGEGSSGTLQSGSVFNGDVVVDEE